MPRLDETESPATDSDAAASPATRRMPAVTVSAERSDYSRDHLRRTHAARASVAFQQLTSSRSASAVTRT